MENSFKYFVDFRGSVFRLLQNSRLLLDLDGVNQRRLAGHLKCIWKRKLVDIYWYKVNKDVTYFYENKIVRFINCEGHDTLERSRIYNKGISKEYYDLIPQLRNVSGCYIFINGEKEILYIGMSSDLSKRILTSFGEHFNFSNSDIFVRYVRTESVLDASVIEQYLISLFKPKLNGTIKFEGKLNVKITHIPKFSKRIPMVGNSNKIITRKKINACFEPAEHEVVQVVLA